MKGLGRQDAGLITARDLEIIEKKIYEAPERELINRTLVKTKSDLPPWIETYTYKVITRRGAAKLYAYRAKDIPLVDQDVTEKSVRIYGAIVGFEVSDNELAAARALGVPLEATKAITARRAIAELENKVFFTGDEEYKIDGFVNYPGIQTYTIPNGALTSPLWKNKTGKEIVADIKNAKNKINENPGLKANVLAIPTTQMGYLDDPYDPEYPMVTIRQYIENQKWFSRIVEVPDLKGQGTGGTDCFVMFDDSEDVVEWILVQDIMMNAPFRVSSKAVQIDLDERFGPVIIRFPLGFVRGEGI